MKIERAASDLKKLYAKEPWLLDVVLANTHFGTAIQVQYVRSQTPIKKLDTFYGYHVHWMLVS